MLLLLLFTALVRHQACLNQLYSSFCFSLIGITTARKSLVQFNFVFLFSFDFSVPCLSPPNAWTFSLAFLFSFFYHRHFHHHFSNIYFFLSCSLSFRGFFPSFTIFAMSLTYSLLIIYCLVTLCVHLSICTLQLSIFLTSYPVTSNVSIS